MKTADERHEEYKTRPRSWSQLSQYEQCPHSFFLERIARVWSRPAAWFATGLGIHSGVEAYEKGEASTLDEMLAVAQKAFRDDVNSRLEETPRADYWQSSGPYHGPEDIPRRYADLRRHLENYLMVAKTRPPIVSFDELAVEWEMDFDLDGVRVIGFADQIREGEIVDVKAGSMVPENPGQLAVGAEAVRQKTGEKITKGVYIMTAKKPTPKGRISAAQVVEKDLTTIPVEALTARFHEADEGIKAGNWDPKPSDACRRCSVASSCDFRMD
ncbi:PD-(D/E)XK nuclease family protein [Amycolatopsis sp. NPDC004772]